MDEKLPKSRADNRTVYKIDRLHHARLKDATLLLSAKLGIRLSQSEAMYLLARYFLSRADEVAEGIRALPPDDAPSEVPDV